jgi:hypothetical protein
MVIFASPCAYGDFSVAPGPAMKTLRTSFSTESQVLHCVVGNIFVSVLRRGLLDLHLVRIGFNRKERRIKPHLPHQHLWIYRVLFSHRTT